MKLNKMYNNNGQNFEIMYSKLVTHKLLLSQNPKFSQNTCKYCSDKG